MKVGAVTDVGKVRDNNEDHYWVLEDPLMLFIVADGMGGHNSGEVASELAIETIKEHLLKYILDENEDESIKGIIFEAFNRANTEILNRSNQDDGCDGMGTTATLALYHEDKLYIGHIGDSRGYIIKEGKIKQITQDHSLVAELLRKGSISEREALKHPQKNIITKALGTDQQVKADVFSIDFSVGDTLILCTDGLSNFVDQYEIEKYALEMEDCQRACQEMVDLANFRGGYDNITIIMIKNNLLNGEGR
ncbi:Stp1/IreP family PP2C-type Ser/Thr phosphatase [Alkaliphilus serpentinus]|uniref:Stp1/IreP family PP2C-type Ser/Thr phosphatase n=1 Tax=Alkaliphilus serpentinus TaxID=1482731 RepID=A0A833HRE9_9FIRM|nr:Stp1/IreP family PP2C-type Ser/Thr phosphatase [Alkaliphilus serpentinus]KAB3533135.1 Stp1/IreP family PP2C-type Ser/Thr phosphatase [Alkaliphilus serpentinus]